MFRIQPLNYVMYCTLRVYIQYGSKAGVGGIVPPPPPNERGGIPDISLELVGKLVNRLDEQGIGKLTGHDLGLTRTHPPGRGEILSSLYSIWRLERRM